MKEKGRKKHTERSEGNNAVWYENTRASTRQHASDSSNKPQQDRTEEVKHNEQNKDVEMRVYGHAGVPIATFANSLPRQ